MNKEQLKLITRTQQFADKTLMPNCIIELHEYLGQKTISENINEGLFMIRGAIQSFTINDVEKNYGNALSLSPLLKWIENNGYKADIDMYNILIKNMDITGENIEEQYEIELQEPSLMSEVELEKLNIILDKIEKGKK